MLLMLRLTSTVELSLVRYFYEYIRLGASAQKRGSVRAKECVRGHVSGDDDVDVDHVELLMLGAQRSLTVCCSSSVG